MAKLQSQMADDIAVLPKEIVKQNTRLPTEFSCSQVHLSSTRCHTIGAIGELPGKIQGAHYGEVGGLQTPDLLGLRREENLTTLDRIRNLKELKQKHQAAETPSINGYKLVNAKELDVVAALDSPIMTWGEVVEEPSYLGRAASTLESINVRGVETEERPKTRPRFEIPDSSQREQLSHELVSKTNRRKALETYMNQERKKLNATPTVYRKVTDLSQSGRRLLEKAGGMTGSIFDKSRSVLRSSSGMATPNVKFNN